MSCEGSVCGLYTYFAVLELLRLQHKHAHMRFSPVRSRSWRQAEGDGLDARLLIEI